MRKLALALIATAGFLAAASSAVAQESRTAARLIADDVMLGSIAVGGMSADQARAAVLATFDVPLRFTFKKRTWKATPSQLGASPRPEAALARALAAAPGAQIPLLTKIESKKLRRYAVYLDRVFTRAARDTRVRIVNSRPKYSKPRPGVRVDRDALTKSLLAALNEHDREPIALPATLIEPAVTPDTFGPVVVIQRGTKRLALYKGRKLVRKFGVATGPGTVSDTDRQLQDRHQAAQSHVEPTQLGLGPRRLADTARSRQPARYALDGYLVAGDRNPRHARRRVDRLLALSWLRANARV